MSQPTPLPWEARPSKNSVAVYGPVERGCHAEIARLCGSGREADAELIVAAVNSYHALLAACRAVLAYDESVLGRAARGQVDLLAGGGGVATGEDLDRLYDAMVSAARAAIEKATAEEPRP